MSYEIIVYTYLIEIGITKDCMTLYFCRVVDVNYAYQDPRSLKHRIIHPNKPQEHGYRHRLVWVEYAEYGSYLSFPTMLTSEDKACLRKTKRLLKFSKSSFAMK